MEPRSLDAPRRRFVATALLPATSIALCVLGPGAFSGKTCACPDVFSRHLLRWRYGGTKCIMPVSDL